MRLFSHLRVAALSDVGKKRQNNEDAFGMFPEAGVFCVADGMGGGDDGEIASAAVVRAVEEAVAEFKPGAVGGFAARDVGAVLSRYLSKASAWICHRAHERRLNGCGATFVGAVFDATDPEHALAVHAGDSRLYLLRGRSITQVTRDHSVAELMGEKDESKVNPMFRSMVVNGIGIRSKAEPEFTPFKVAPGDRVLVCSDGLTRMVPDKKILSVSRSAAKPEDAVRALIDAALDAGGIDNVTAVLIEVGKLPPPVLRLEAPAVPEPSSEAETMDEVVTGGAATGSTGGTVTGATQLAEIAEESPFGIEAPADTLPQDGTAPIGADESLDEEGPEERTETPTIGPQRKRSRRLRFPFVALLLVIVAVCTVVVLNNGPKATCERTDTISLVSSDVSPAAETIVSRSEPEATASDDTCASSASDGTDNVDQVPSAVSTNAVSVESVAAPTDNPPEETSSCREPLPPQPSAPIDSALAEFVAACGEESSLRFVRALRRMAPREGLNLDFDSETDRFLKSASQLARQRGAREAEATVVDLRVLLLNAESVRSALAVRRSEATVGGVLSAWSVILCGDPAQVTVQKACVRILRALPEVRVR